MTNNHDTLKKIWITEFGSPTGGPGPTSTASAPLLNQGPTHVDEALSAQSLEAALKLYNAAPWAGPFFYYSYQDNGTTNDTNENFFGLIRADGTHKPAYQIFDAAARAK
jgi:hypothetical protein